MRKSGFHKGVQRYKCASCNRKFLGGNRIDVLLLWQQYTKGKQSYTQLALKYNCSIKTIQRKLDTHKIVLINTFPSIVNLLMDTTYFGRNWRVMVFKDGITKQILFKLYVKQETNKLYLQGIEEITRRGIKIQAIVCDGRRGLFK